MPVSHFSGRDLLKMPSMRSSKKSRKRKFNFGEYTARKVRNVCLTSRNRWRIFRGGVRTLQRDRVFLRPIPTTTQLFANGSPLAQHDRRFSPQRIIIHCFHMLCLVISHGPGYRPSSTHKGWGNMQDAGYGLLRILLPRIRVNRGSRKGQSTMPRPFLHHLPFLVG
jgi:hypothetical protein